MSIGTQHHELSQGRILATYNGVGVAIFCPYVYKLYAGDGEVLYIGYTELLTMRLHEHRRTKPWFPLVKKIRVRMFHGGKAGHKAAMRYERAEILRLRPPGNSLSKWDMKNREAREEMSRKREALFYS